MKYNSIEKFDSIWELFKRSAKKYESKSAFVYFLKRSKREITFGQFYSNVKKLAQFLVDQNIKPGDKIIIYSETRAEWLFLFFASSLIRSVIVPIDIESPESMVKQILEETSPKMLFRSEKVKFPIKYDFQTELVAEDIYKVLYETKEINARSYEKEIEKEDLLEIMYTSGTTGKPKGVEITNKTLTTNIYNALLIFPIEKNYSALEILPLSHSYAQILTLGLINIGGRLVFVDSVNGDEIKYTLNSNYINAIPAVPQFLVKIKGGIEKKFAAKKMGFLLKGMHAIGAFAPKPLKKVIFKPILKQLGGHLKLIIAGGAALDPEVYKWWHNMGLTVLKGYGLTETGPILSLDDKNQPDPTSVGIPLPYQKLKIVDGEIYAKGDHVTPGYFNNSEKTRESFDENGWYKTGDMGFIKNGKLFLNGRLKERIVLENGRNIYPKDIEFVINSNKEIEDCVVTTSKVSGKIELVAVLLTKASDTQIEEIITKANKKLGVNQWIQNFVIWPDEDFPRTHTKKVKRPLVEVRVDELLQNKLNKIKVNPEKQASMQFDTTDIPEKPGLELERYMNILQQTLSRKDLSPDFEFTKDLKLDSLGRAEIIAILEKEFEVNIDETKIDTDTSLQELFELVSKSPASSYDNNFKNIKIHTWPASKLLWLIRIFLIFPICRLILLFFFRIKVKGDFPSTNKQFLIISNHRSNIDPIILSLVTPLRILRNSFFSISGFHWDDTYRKNVRFLLKTLIPGFTLQESSAKNAINTTSRFLNEGYNVVIYPEGKLIHEVKDRNHFKLGTAQLIKEFELPVLLIKTDGLNKIKKGKFLPKIGFNKLDVEVEYEKINPHLSVEEINSILENKFKGF